MPDPTIPPSLNDDIARRCDACGFPEEGRDYIVSKTTKGCLCLCPGCLDGIAEQSHAYAAAWVEVKRLVRDSCDDHTHLQDACRKAGIAERLIVGDSHGVPGIGDLADMLMARVAELEAALRPMADMEIWYACKYEHLENAPDSAINANHPIGAAVLWSRRAAAVLAEKP